MADRGWRTDPYIQEAKRVAVATDSAMAILLLVGKDGIRMATYGRNGALCKQAEVLGDMAFDAIMEVEA